ncbi:MAG TPA: SgcJ/EcaC family oxidoreductase [Pyrinomonadaceae bacterium]|nr:SgcJ/EcaC family oxidoreductase [Pyrinomonadaceae bacterium]
MFRKRGVVLMILNVMSTAFLCLPLSFAETVLPQDHGADLKDDISKPGHLWAKEWNAHNLDAIVDLYAEDAVFLTAGGTRTTGRAAIRELFKQAFAATNSQLSVQSKATEQSGNLAYDSGEYDETSTSNGVTKSRKGNYLVVLRREKNRWRIVQHMWTDAGAK